MRLEVWDVTGNKRTPVDVSDDVSVERILLVLAEKLELPRVAPDGQLMSYKFHHRRLAKQLRDDQTLGEQGVVDADVLRIQPEITAGGTARVTDVISVTTGDAHERYHRQSLIPWWNQEKVAAARILVVGAGALGNEIGKLLALTGIGRVLVFDPDTVERSNLSRSVLFRDSDEGRPKVDAVAVRMRELNPAVAVVGRRENVMTQAGLGLFLWADVVIGAVDNREARLFVNSACARVGRAWIDGAIEGLAGVVRVFEPARSSCYECTMNATDWKLVAQRRSCAMLARNAVALGHVPSTAVAASIVGAFEVQEAIKHLHGQPTLLGEGLHLDGLWADVSRVTYPRREDCLGHDSLGPITPLGLGGDDVTLGELLERACAQLGAGAVLELSRDMIVRLLCPGCGADDRRGRVLGTVREREAACPACGVHRTVEVAASVGRGGPVDLALTPAQLGLPPYDVIAARNGADRLAWLLDGDAARALGPLASPSVAPSSEMSSVPATAGAGAPS